MSQQPTEPPVIINETGLSDEDIRQLRAMGFEVADQGSEEWQAERLGLATSSKFYDIVNWTKGTKPTKNNPDGTPPKPQATYYKYRNEVLAERLTGERKRFGAKAMTWGINHEQDAADAYQAETGNEIATLGFIKHPELQAGASLDREVVEQPGCVEIKCPNADTMIDYVINDAPPPQYWTQMQGQMWIGNKEWCDFVTWDPWLEKLFIKRVVRDDTYIKDILEPRVIRFLAEVDQLEEKLRSQGYGRTNW